MARMPRGQPRSVPDPAGDAYDEMLRQKRALEGAPPLQPSPSRDEFSLLKPQFAPGDFAPKHGPTVTRGRGVYREIDNGRANVLVPVDTSPLTPEQRARRRDDVARIMYMAGNPLASGAYGIAVAAGASPQATERALIAGGMADALMLGVAPRGVPVRSPVSAPRSAAEGPALRPEPIRYRPLNEKGQATGGRATLTKSTLGTGTKSDRRLKPPGWSGHGTIFNEARGHLVARQLGGNGRRLDAITTLTHNGANTPQMRKFENALARRVREGEVVEYASTPLYGEGALPPAYVLLSATGSRKGPVASLIRNPAGHPGSPARLRGQRVAP